MRQIEFLSSTRPKPAPGRPWEPRWCNWAPGRVPGDQCGLRGGLLQPGTGFCSCARSEDTRSLRLLLHSFFFAWQVGRLDRSIWLLNRRGFDRGSPQDRPCPPNFMKIKSKKSAKFFHAFILPRILVPFSESPCDRPGRQLCFPGRSIARVRLCLLYTSDAADE